MNSFRPLVVFWILLLVLLGGGAATLQYLGPRSHLLAAAAPKTPPAGTPAPATAEAAPKTPAPQQPAPRTPATTERTIAIPAPDPALEEPAVDIPDRMLPRIGGNGATPAETYAAAFDPNEKHPRIALLIDGVGLDQAMSEQVLKTLPRTVDVAFSAYAPAAVLDALATAARAQGRECLVSIPMEPAGFPAAEEGDRALLTGNSPDQNRLNLEWALSNVQGCVGATNASDGMQGERYAESRQSFTDLLSFLDHRGLIYLDARPGAPPLDDTAGIHTPPRIADVVLDKSLSPDEPATADTIDHALARLERLAAEHGSAIGVAGPPRPVLLERLLVFINALPAKNLVLAPLTAMPLPKPPTSQDASP
jgi:polysaccharide deacetylase 2 family uncharacterized protein YibQ